MISYDALYRMSKCPGSAALAPPRLVAASTPTQAAFRAAVLGDAPGMVDGMGVVRAIEPWRPEHQHAHAHRDIGCSMGSLEWHESTTPLEKAMAHAVADFLYADVGQVVRMDSGELRVQPDATLCVDIVGAEDMSPLASEAYAELSAMLLARLVKAQHVRVKLVLPMVLGDTWATRVVEYGPWGLGRLLDIENRVRSTYSEAVLQLKMQEPTLRQGLHCQQCSGYAACPKKVELGRSIGGVLTNIKSYKKTRMTPAERAKVAEVYLLAAKAVDTLRPLLEEDAEAHGPIVLADGRHLGFTNHPHTFVYGDLTYAVLEPKFGPEVARAAAPRVASKTTVESAIHAHARRGEKGALLEEAFRLLRANGAIVKDTQRQFRVHSAGSGVAARPTMEKRSEEEKGWG